MVNLGIKDAVKEWVSEKWENWVKRPITDYTVKTEDQVSQKWNEYSGKAKEQINKHSDQIKTQIKKPGEYYYKQNAFYRGLFWIAVGCLIVLWIISGS